MLSILTQFLSNRSQHVKVDGCWSKWLTLCQECQWAVFWACFCFACTLQSFFFILKIELISYADNSTVKVIVPSPGVRVTVAESLIRDLGKVSKWCDLWGMKLNASMTMTIIVSMSRTMHPQSPPLTIGRTALKESDDLDTLGVTFYSKITVDKHLRTVSRAASQRLGTLRKSLRVFHDRSHLGRCTLGFLLPVLEYCSAEWCSDADTHLKLLDHVVRGARFLTWVVSECDIAHRQSVAVLCMLYKIRCNPMHPLYGALAVPYVPVRIIRCALVAHRYTYAHLSCRTSQYSRTFILLAVSLWNDFADPVIDGVGLASFKSRAKAFLLAKADLSFFVIYYFSLSLLSDYWMVLCGRSLD